MYVGHVGLALAIRAQRDAAPLWLLILAAQAPDWIDPVLTAIGHYPADDAWSAHGLPMIALGAATASAVAMLIACGRSGRLLAPALTAAAAYVSHWAGDYLTGIKPTWPGHDDVGLGWYVHPRLDLALETIVVLAGWWLWRRSLPAARRGHLLARVLLASLLILQLLADVVMARGLHVL